MDSASVFFGIQGDHFLMFVILLPKRIFEMADLVSTVFLQS